MNKKKWLEQAFYWILLAAGLGIFALLLRRVGITRLSLLYLDAEKSFWIYGVIVYTASMFFRAMKWHMLLGMAKPLGFSDFLPVYLFNAYMGNITPFKSGEAVGPVLFKRYFQIEIGQGFSVLFIDRIIELIWMLVCLGAGFFYLAMQVPLSPVLSKTILLGGAFTAVLILFLLSVLLIEPLGRGGIAWALKRSGNGRFRRLIQQIQAELSVFYQFSRQSALRPKMILLNIYTLLAFISQFMAVWFVVLSLIPVNFLASLSAQAIAIPISIISFIPAGIGISALGYQSIMGLFGYPYHEIVGAALISKILFLGLIFISGWLASLVMHRRTEHSA